MVLLFIALIVVLVCLISFFVLIQNPKGGGMDSSVMGGTGNQFFGVQRSTDILEKGTWIFATLIAILCLTSAWFIAKPNNSISKESEYLQQIKTNEKK